MKLYTKRGDRGQTDLFGGQRVDKNHARVEAVGQVDELNSVIGLAVCVCNHDASTQQLRQIQSRLFEIGADLATPRDGDDAAESHVPRIEDRHIDELEQWIDAISGELPAMRTFILPGGSEPAARLHHARCVCRRAERACVALRQQDDKVGDSILIYLNRLSDLLFAMARLANQLADVDDVPWTNPKSSQ